MALPFVPMLESGLLFNDISNQIRFDKTYIEKGFCVFGGGPPSIMYQHNAAFCTFHRDKLRFELLHPIIKCARCSPKASKMPTGRRVSRLSAGDHVSYVSNHWNCFDITCVVGHSVRVTKVCPQIRP
jgi:hypothetical protein